MSSDPASSKRTLAIFGATGGTGSETLKSLLANPSNPFHIRAYVRSKAKLLSMFPALEIDDRVNITEGQVTDLPRVKRVLGGADTIVCALGENDNRPGIRVLTDASRTIATALQQLKDEAKAAEWTKPRLLLLSSATWNKNFNAQQPALMLFLVKRAFYYTYADLRNAHETFRKGERQGLLSLLLVQPPAIIDEEGSGHHIAVESTMMTVSYPDLGAGFAELAIEGGYGDLKEIMVWSESSKEGFSRYGMRILTRMVRGLLACYVPGFWRINGMINKMLS